MGRLLRRVLRRRSGGGVAGGAGVPSGTTSSGGSSSQGPTVAIASVSFANGVVQKAGEQSFTGYGGIFNVTPNSIMLAQPAPAGPERPVQRARPDRPPVRRHQRSERRDQAARRDHHRRRRAAAGARTTGAGTSTSPTASTRTPSAAGASTAGARTTRTSSRRSTSPTPTRPSSPRRSPSRTSGGRRRRASTSTRAARTRTLPVAAERLLVQHRRDAALGVRPDGPGGSEARGADAARRRRLALHPAGRPALRARQRRTRRTGLTTRASSRCSTST